MKKSLKSIQVFLETSGSGNIYLKNPVRRDTDFRVAGTWGLLPTENTISLYVNRVNIGSLNGEDFYNLCQRVQGCKYPEVRAFLKEYKFDTTLIEDSVPSLDLLKAAINIFLWMEPCFQIPFDIDNEQFVPEFFNEFVLDSSSSIGTQKDIYLLPEGFPKENYKTEIETLVSMNLLSSVKLKVDKKQKENYFIPFTKPGYTKYAFPNSSSFALWNHLLDLRNRCFDDFQKNLLKF